MENIVNWEIYFQPCNYSDQLINKLEQLNKNGSQININYIKKAIFYAKKYHGTQLRKSGDPYYSHPLEVASMVAEHLPNTNAITISILHDVIEDTELNSKMIAYIFSPKIAQGVVALTRIKDGKKYTAADTVVSLWSQKKYDLLIIKLFDRLHNVRTLFAKSPESIEKISKETLEIFIAIAISLGLKDVEIELSNLCVDYYNSAVGYDNRNEISIPYGSDEAFLSILGIKNVLHPI